jgi:hypothetical protein
MKIVGKFVKGYGYATHTIQFQLPYFREEGLPNTEDIITGTLNTDISPDEYKILKYDYFYKGIPNGSDAMEDFGFIIIDKIVHKGRTYEHPGYIYVPYGSPHVGNQLQFEVIACRLEDKDNGDEVEIHVADGKLIVLAPLKKGSVVS